MSVDVYWKRKLGEVVYFDKENKRSWKLEMFAGNVMCAFVYRYGEKDEKTGKRKKWSSLFMFFNDLAHAKRCMSDFELDKLPCGTHVVRKIRLCIQGGYPCDNKSANELAKLFVAKGYKVELYRR